MIRLVNLHGRECSVFPRGLSFKYWKRNHLLVWLFFCIQFYVGAVWFLTRINPLLKNECLHVLCEAAYTWKNGKNSFVTNLTEDLGIFFPFPYYKFYSNFVPLGFSSMEALNWLGQTVVFAWSKPKTVLWKEGRLV